MKAQKKLILNFIELQNLLDMNILQSESKVIKVFDEGIVLDKTPFYATGGQVQIKEQLNGARSY